MHLLTRRASDACADRGAVPHCPLLWGYFIKYAGAYVSMNVKPTRRLSNGARVILLSFTLRPFHHVATSDFGDGDDSSALVRDHAAVAASETATPGTLFVLSCAPLSVNVVLLGCDAGAYTDARVGVVTVPVHIDVDTPARSTPALRLPVLPLLATCPIKLSAYATGLGRADLTATSHNYELDLAASYHKAQGRETLRTISDVDGISFAALVVCMSRTALQRHSWVFPPRAGDFSSLANLRRRLGLAADPQLRGG